MRVIHGIKLFIRFEFPFYKVEDPNPIRDAPIALVLVCIMTQPT